MQLFLKQSSITISMQIDTSEETQQTKKTKTCKQTKQNSKEACWPKMMTKKAYFTALSQKNSKMWKHPWEITCFSENSQPLLNS